MNIRTPLLATICLLILCGSFCAAQIGPELTESDREEFMRHRDQLRDSIDEGIIVLFGTYDREDHFRFRQSNLFYYFTGVETPNAALVINKHTGEDILFLPTAKDEWQTKWVAPVLGSGEEAVLYYGTDKALPLHEIEPYLSSQSASAIWTYLAPEEVYCGMDQWSAAYYREERDKLPWADYQTREERIKDWFVTSFPDAQLMDITTNVNELRSFKSEWELRRMRRAVDVTENAFRAVLPFVHSGVNEFQVEAVILKEFVNGGAHNVSYSSIVAGGGNGNIIHYRENNMPLRNGDLLVMDFGCDYQYYSTDISRTIPVNGTFTEEQRKYYEIILDIQNELIAMCKPGITMLELNRENKRLMQSYGIEEFSFPVICHFIGMSVHDVTHYGVPLAEGSVIAVEPGVYFPEKGFGIRIEDDVLITKDGAELLSKNIPKSIEDIERLMR